MSSFQLLVWFSNSVVELMWFTYSKLFNKGLENGWGGASGFASGLDEYLTTHFSFKFSIPRFLFKTLRLIISLLQIFFPWKKGIINYH